MVRPRPSAAAEERQRKLQEYLAAKGKLKCHNDKPYLKAKNNCPNPPHSKSTLRPKKDLTSHVALPVKVQRPTSAKLQSRPANIPGPQKPRLEPLKLPDKRLASARVSSNSNCEPSGSCQQQREAGSSTRAELSLTTQGQKTARQQKTDQGDAQCIGAGDNTHMGNESWDNCLKETNKENLPCILSDSERKLPGELWTTSKTKVHSHNPTKSSVAPKQNLGKCSGKSAALKDQVNKQFHIRNLPAKSQQLSREAELARPGGRALKTASSALAQASSRIQATRKPAVTDIKASRGQYKKANETKFQLHTINKEKAKISKPRTCPSVLQGDHCNRYANIKQDHRSTQPCSRPQTSCVLQKSKAFSQRPTLAAVNFNPVVPSTPSLSVNGINGNKCNTSCRPKVQTVDSKLQRPLPQNRFLSRTVPKTRVEGTALKARRVPEGTRTNADVKNNAAEMRRKQLEEWQKSKGKIYKRPPMELKTKRKVIEKMNISFWKSMEREEEEKKEQLELSNKINNTLTECLQLIERGILSNELFTILSSIPEAEKFAKFWICKAKLMASKGTFDVIGLYEEAIKSGAMPIQELREFVFKILQNPNEPTKALTDENSVTKTDITSIEELTEKVECGRSCLSPKRREEVIATPQIRKAEPNGHTGIKLQVAPVPRINGMPEVQDMKLITPVRRSARIERALSQYPDMLQEHDVVVSSLDDLLDVEDTEYFIFRKNEALPVTLGFQMHES
ncbi:cytoskeleton-associated protein 2-like [Sorex araneus]|uniref:cytoskeleton-associated protein 2-like n=1 Tax=Sorex araneus TaxID=42254 RepID=UPI00243344F0|nr:cytoskeleton-associated protein 2-like [Sorex araneus]